MGAPIYRSDFKKLAEIRLRDSEVLSDVKRWRGAYYLAGYALENAVKACVARQSGLYEFPDKDRAKAAWTHKLSHSL